MCQSIHPAIHPSIHVHPLISGLSFGYYKLCCCKLMSVDTCFSSCLPQFIWEFTQEWSAKTNKNSVFNFFLRALQSGFHSGYNILHSHQQCTRTPAFPHVQHLKIVIISGCEHWCGVCIHMYYIYTYIRTGHMKRRHLRDFEGESLVLSGDFLLIACGSVAWLVNLSLRRQFQWIKRKHNAAMLPGANVSSHCCL